jgi:hypothetical protein
MESDVILGAARWVSNVLLPAQVAGFELYAQHEANKYGIERRRFDPFDPAAWRASCLHLLLDRPGEPSRCLHDLPGARIAEYAADMLQADHVRSVYYHNNCAGSIWSTGHWYRYRGRTIRLTPDGIDRLEALGPNALRALIRLWFNGGLELAPRHMEAIRSRFTQRGSATRILADVRAMDSVRRYQEERWLMQAPLAGCALLGKNSVVRILRSERYVLDCKILVDMLLAATTEIHVLDGTSLWLRAVDRATGRLVFSVVGSGQHPWMLVDSANHLLAPLIWHYLSQMHAYLLDDFPGDPAAMAETWLPPLEARDPHLSSLHRTLVRADALGGLGQRLRNRAARETGQRDAD